MRVIYYTPVLGPKKGRGDWYQVNGATTADRERSISLASKHVGIRSGRDEIKRVDEEERDED